jgi:cytochrome c-type biogenesis protein CcmF
VFVLGACFESAFKAEAAQALPLGGTMRTGGYELRLDQVGAVQGPNYDATRGVVSITRSGKPFCTAFPERRFYPAGGQTTSEVHICPRGLDDVYVVFGDRQPGAGGQAAWVVRAYVNPWARLIFFGPIIMALGGLVSLSDRRLRFGLARKAAPAMALEPAE